MPSLKDTFNVFSTKKLMKSMPRVSTDVRNRFFLLIINIHVDEGYGSRYNQFYIEEFSKEILNILMMRFGKLDLINGNETLSSNLFRFLSTCKDEEFLDFFEDMFKTQEIRKVSIEQKQQLIEDINIIFIQFDLPFKLTNYVEHWVETQDYRYKTIKLDYTIYPKIICNDNNIINKEVINPTLELLYDSRFKNANQEFMDGLLFYKNKNYKETISSCCCALESCLKIVCNLNKWQYNENATGLPLIKTIIEKSKTYTWYESILSSPFTMRNKLSAHGKGQEKIIVKKEEAELQINLVASEIQFIVNNFLQVH